MCYWSTRNDQFPDLCSLCFDFVLVLLLNICHAVGIFCSHNCGNHLVFILFTLSQSCIQTWHVAEQNSDTMVPSDWQRDCPQRWDNAHPMSVNNTLLRIDEHLMSSFRRGIACKALQSSCTNMHVCGLWKSCAGKTIGAANVVSLLHRKVQQRRAIQMHMLEPHLHCMSVQPAQALDRISGLARASEQQLLFAWLSRVGLLDRAWALRVSRRSPTAFKSGNGCAFRKWRVSPEVCARGCRREQQR